MIKDDFDLSNLITGSLLGDGAIIKSFDKRQNTFNYYFSESHGKRQAEYLRWKSSYFESEGFKSNISFRDRKSSLGTREIATREYRFHSYGNAAFKPLRQYWYPNDTKQVPIDVELSPLSLAVWYMDDGSYDVFRGKIELSSYGFDLASHKVLQKELARFNIEASIASKNRKGKQYYYIYLPRSSAWKFLTLTEPFMHEELSYKWPKGYELHSLPKDRKFGKRTISTKISIVESQQMIIDNLKQFWEIDKNMEGFTVVKYLYWERSYSQKPIQRLFGSFAAALTRAELPDNFV